MSTQSTVKVGVIGMGWAGQAHLENYLRLPNVEIVGISDTREARLQELAQRFPVNNVYLHYEDLLNNDEIDVISVATPNFLHAPVAIAALERGKHVLCEKPMAMTVEEGERMVKTALANNRVLEVAFNHRRRGDVEVLKRHIDTGALGQVYHAKASWMRRRGIPGFGGWFTTKAQSGGGPLIDLGVHMLDMALYLMGEPEITAVSAMTYAEFGPKGRGSRNTVSDGLYDVEDMATAFIRLKGGATLLLEASWATHSKSGDDFGVTLYGTEGGADIAVKNYNWEDTLRIYTDVGGVPSDVAPRVYRGEGHLAVVREFLEVIASGKDWAAHAGQEGLRRTQILEACYRSAQEGREIPLVDAASAITSKAS